MSPANVLSLFLQRVFSRLGPFWKSSPVLSTARSTVSEVFLEACANYPKLEWILMLSYTSNPRTALTEAGVFLWV